MTLSPAPTLCNVSSGSTLNDAHPATAGTFAAAATATATNDNANSSDKPHQPPKYISVRDPSVLSRTRTHTRDGVQESDGEKGRIKATLSRLNTGNGTQQQPFVVRWQDGDERNPLNWSHTRRYLITAVVATEALVVAFGSSVYGSAGRQLVTTFSISSELVTLGLSLYVLGFAFGPLVWAPLSEMFGRRPVFIVCYGIFTFFNLGAAFAQNFATVLVCRCIGGFFGSAPITNSAAVVSDLFSTSERALAMSFFCLAPFMGPVVGPIVGGFISQNVSWRWIFYVMTMFSFTVWVAGCFVPETYGPVLLRLRAQQLTEETGQIYVSEYDLNIVPGEGALSRLKTNIARPVTMLFMEPIATMFAIYAAVVYGVLYLLFGAMNIVFEETRHWSLSMAGLPFIGVGIGMALALVLNFFSTRKYMRDTITKGAPLPAEARLPISILGGALLPIGLFWFAWTVQPSVPWIVPCIAVVPFGMGMVLIFLSVTNYLVDSYLRFAASALAANALLRSILGAVFPLFTAQMFHKLGNNWALTLLAFLGLALVPIPVVFYLYGAQIRSRSMYALGHKAVTRAISPTPAQERRFREIEQADLRQEEDLEATISRISVITAKVSESQA